MPESGTSGSVGAAGKQLPAATRPLYFGSLYLARMPHERVKTNNTEQ